MKRTKNPTPERKKGSLTTQMEESASRIEKPERAMIDTSILIPSGSTMLNCACTDNPFGAYALGQIVTLPGGSTSGKTIAMLTSLAECNIDKRFDDYDLIFDDGEESLYFDVSYLFGSLGERLKAPGYDGDIPKYSITIQDFKSNILGRCKAGNPFIYILDSLDSLTSDEELKKEFTAALARAKSDAAVEELKGSYKTEKAKAIGEALRMINNHLKKTKSALFIVQQIRAKIGAMPFEKQTTTSGGNAPYFYSTHQVWLTKTGQYTKEAQKQKRKVGNSVKAEVTKNKITGKLREVNFDVFYDYGIDDISSCIDFLVSTRHWKKEKQTIDAHDLGFSGIKSKLVEFVENEGAEKTMQETVGKVWNSIEEDVRLGRKPKYE